jgi:hypothetical protein
MISGKKLCLVILASAFSLPAFADCALPTAPAKVPDGSTAKEAEMVAAMNTLKQYDADVNTYVKCLEFEAKQNRLSREEQARKHNAAIR